MTSEPSDADGDHAGKHEFSGDASRASPALTDDALTVELAIGADVQVRWGQSFAEPEPGDVLGSRYLLEQVVGRGGTSWVYRARDLRPGLTDTTGNLVAVKVSRAGQGQAPQAARLQREFHATRGLCHPGIARVMELDCDGDIWFMSMELIAGQTLKAWMTAGDSHAEAVKIIDSCCETLEYAHSRGVVHGDLEPTNVLVTDDGTVKLIGFGSAWIPIGSADLGSTPAAAATPLYASPQILAGHQAEPLDDVFSLACLSYSILSGGRHPYGGRPSFEAFRAKSAPTYVRAIPIELFEVIERGLSADRDLRPASVGEFRRELIEAEQRRSARAIVSQPVPSTFVQKSLPEPPRLAPAMSALARRMALLARCLGEGLRLQRVKRMVVTAIALVAAVVAAATLFSHIGSTQARPGVTERLPQPKIESAHAPTIALKALTPRFAPAPEPTPPLPSREAPLPHDSSSISFKTAIIHTSARQSLVAITVTRDPANRSPGPFAWRVEPGNAIPSIDYQRVKPRRAKFIEGQKARTLFIPLLNKTTSDVPRGPRFFDVVLQPVAGGPALGRIARITVVIDPAPDIWVAKSDSKSTDLR